MNPLTRREALKTAATLLGGALVLPVLLSGCARDDRETTSSRSASAVPSDPAQDDTALLEDIADTLLPTTAASPGAKAAGVGATMALLLADCKSADVQQRVAAGLLALRSTCRTLGGAFATLPQAERERLLRDIDAAAVRTGDAHWFGTVRELAQGVYFSSEVGLTRAMRYVTIPGRYRGCVPLAPGAPFGG